MSFSSEEKKMSFSSKKKSFYEKKNDEEFHQQTQKEIKKKSARWNIEPPVEIHTAQELMHVPFSLYWIRRPFKRWMCNCMHMKWEKQGSEHTRRERKKKIYENFRLMCRIDRMQLVLEEKNNTHTPSIFLRLYVLFFITIFFICS